MKRQKKAPEKFKTVPSSKICKSNAEKKASSKQLCKYKLAKTK